MTKENWAVAWKRLNSYFRQAKLIVDGYEITLEMQTLKDGFHRAILVYVDGYFKGEWLVKDCEERRRFMPQKEVSAMSRKQIAKFNALPKRMQKELQEYRDQKVVQYATHWTSWNALIKHFEANNQEIRLCDETEV